MNIFTTFCFFSFFIIVKVNGFGENDYYYENWCGECSYCIEYLDDSQCNKKFPSHFDRDWTCPVSFSQAGPGFAQDVPLDQVVVDLAGLTNIASTRDVNMMLILIKRVGSEVWYKYLSNGDLHLEPYETWSSSKIFAMANAAGRMRSSCAEQGVDCGLEATVEAKPLGDLATIIASYDETQGYTSNSLSAYFHDIGQRDRINALVTEWLGAEDQSLGGNYGEAPPDDLGFDFTDTDDDTSTCSLDPDDPVTSYPNSLSALSTAELTRRLVLFRDILPQNRFPGTSWQDSQVVMYGSSNSALFPGLEWGGMTADTAIFVQSGLNMSQVDEVSQGKWRIFSKLGAGFSSSRLKGEITYTSYTCLPVLDQGQVVVDAGVEFILAARASVLGDQTLTTAEARLQQAVADVTQAVLDGLA